MEAGYIPAISALAGSAIGALASFATSWLNQHAQHLSMRQLQDRARREKLYIEFIQEASRLFGDAFEHTLEDPAKMVRLYAMVSVMRLFGQPRTLQEAEKVIALIGATYLAPNKDLEVFGNIELKGGDLDPLYAFSQACRLELQPMRR